MNASSWRKAADLVAQGTQANQQVQAAATADSSQLESLPLSALSADDSGPAQVNYGTEQPLAASTPRAMSTSIPETQATDTYHQIIGMSKHLYPTLVAYGSLSTPVADNCSTLQNQITSEIDKYLQEAGERHERDDNYFDRWHVATNTSSPQQEANFLEQDEEDDEARVPESNGQDTGAYGPSPSEQYIQYQDELETIPEEEDEDPQMAKKQDVDEQDTVLFTPDESKEEPFNTAIDDTSDDPTIVIVMGKPITTAFISDVHIPTEKVDCLQVTSQFQEFLNHFPTESKENMIPQLDGTFNVSDNSDTDSHSYLDLAGSNIIPYRTRGQKQRHDENEKVNTYRCSALKDYTKPNTKVKIQRQKVPDDKDIDIDKIVKGDKPKDDRNSATKTEKQYKEKEAKRLTLEKVKRIQMQKDMKGKEAKRLAKEKAQIEALIEKHRPHTPKTPDEVSTLGTGKNAKVDGQDGTEKGKPPCKKVMKDTQIKKSHRKG